MASVCFLFCLFNTYYLLSNENPLFVILSLVACLFSFLRRVLTFIIYFSHFTLLFAFSFRVKFVWYLWCIVRPLSYSFVSFLFVIICCWFTRVKIVHHRLRLSYLQKYSLTLIIEISRFLMSRFHNLLLLVLHTSLLLCFFLINDDRFLAGGELNVLSDEIKVTSRKGWDLLVVETSFNVCCAVAFTYP